jgi:hypothetical protein
MKKHLVQLTEVKLKEYEKMSDKDIAFISNFCVSASEEPLYAGERDSQLYSGPLNTLVIEGDSRGDVPLKKRIIERVERDYDAMSKRGNFYGREGTILYLKSVPTLIFDGKGEYELIVESLLERGDKKIKKSERKYEEELRERAEQKSRHKVERTKTVEDIIFEEMIDAETLRKMYHNEDEYRIMEMDDQNFEQAI